MLFLFAVAVLGLGLLSAATAHFVLSFGRAEGEPLSAHHVQLVICAALATWGIILVGSAAKTASLRAGGHKVAESLGGTLIARNLQDDVQVQRALNVVEEMAIAASLPVPPLYILKGESSINAFAAGWSIDDAVIGVTQGAIDRLNREQLQGVVAHEFSHIINRDCALNMRLLGVLHGIVVISTIGRVIMRLTSSSRHRSTKREGGVIQLFVVGAAIWAFGSIGVLIARLIQAAVSQQREFLADASAVQFTRNPLGIAGALAQIGSQSSALSSPYAADSSHMLIGNPSASGLSGLLSSHPPLFERISRVLPNWDGDFASLMTRAEAPAPSRASVAPQPSPGHETAHFDPLMAPHLVAAAKLLDSTRPDLTRAAREPFSARALLVLWTLDEDPRMRQEQRALLINDRSLDREVQLLQDAFWALPSEEHLPLFDLTLPTLAVLSDEQRRDFAHLLDALRARLSSHSYRAYCLSKVALRHLDPHSKSRTKQRLLIKTAVETTVAVLARAGHPTREEAERAFDLGCKSLAKRGQSLRFPNDADLDVQALDASLSTLRALPIQTRKAILDAAEIVAAHDGIIEPSEAQLLRVIAVALDLAAPVDATQ